MKYKVTVDYSPVYELFISLGMYLFPIKSSELGKILRKKMNEVIPKPLKEELVANKDVVLTEPFFLLVWQCPCKEDTQACLAWIEERSAGELYELLNPYLPNLSKRIPRLTEWRDELIEVMYLWRHVYGPVIHRSLFQQLEEDAKAKREQLKSQEPGDVVEQTLRGIRVEPVDGLEEVILVPGYHFGPANLRFDLHGRMVYLYPVELSSAINPDAFDEMRFIRMTRALADSARIDILRTLVGQTLRFTDITKATGMPKSTVHNHLLTLRDAGFVRVNAALETPDTYSLREDGFQVLQGDLGRLVQELGQSTELEAE